MRPKVGLTARMVMMNRGRASISFFVACPMTLEGVATRKFFIAHIANEFLKSIVNFVDVLDELVIICR
jgi:hypothetical protein